MGAAVDGTALLDVLGALIRTGATGTRVVHVGSLSHRLPLGRDPWASATDPRREPSLVSYGRSKLAVTLFGMELARRFAATLGGHAEVLYEQAGDVLDTT